MNFAELRDGGRVRLTLEGGGRSADEAVGIVLLPILIALVVVSLTYLFAILALALAGRDPAIATHGAEPIFLGIGIVSWVASTVRYRLTHPSGEAAPSELQISDESVAFRPSDGEGWLLRWSQIDHAEARSSPQRCVRLVVTSGDAQAIPMDDESTACALAAALNQRLGARRPEGEE